MALVDYRRCMGRIFVRFLSALVIGAGAGLVTYLVVFELSAWETVASLGGAAVGMVVGIGFLVAPLDDVLDRPSLLLALVGFPVGAALIGWSYDSIPVLDDLHLRGQWGYIAVFAAPAVPAAGVAWRRGASPLTTLLLTLTAAALTPVWAIITAMALISIVGSS